MKSIDSKKILIIVIPILLVIASLLAYLNIDKSSNNVTDASKFKEEYEALNGKNSIFGSPYKNLSIDKSNPIKYIDYNKLFELLENGTGIVYLGYPSCQECRVAIDVLLDVLKEDNVEDLYYMNMENERDYYVVAEGKLVYAKDDNGKEIKGTDNYFKLLDKLDKYLSDYVIMVEDKTYEVGEKRIFTPSIIFIEDGKVLGVEISIVGSELEGNDELSKEEYEELFSTYEHYILNMYSSTCSTDSSC